MCRMWAKTAETTVGITVFFDEDMPEDQILAAGDVIQGWEEVRERSIYPLPRHGRTLRQII